MWLVITWKQNGKPEADPHSLKEGRTFADLLAIAFDQWPQYEKYAGIGIPSVRLENLRAWLDTNSHTSFIYGVDDIDKECRNLEEYPTRPYEVQSMSA